MPTCARIYLSAGLHICSPPISLCLPVPVYTCLSDYVFVCSPTTSPCLPVPVSTCLSDYVFVCSPPHLAMLPVPVSVCVSVRLPVCSLYPPPHPSTGSHVLCTPHLSNRVHYVIRDIHPLQHRQSDPPHHHHQRLAPPLRTPHPRAPA